MRLRRLEVGLREPPPLPQKIYTQKWSVH
jgi:hypothetical protein